MSLIRMLFTLLIIVVGIAFAALNNHEVMVNYLIGSRDYPLAILLLIAFATGILLSILIMGVSILKLKTQKSWLENKLKRTQEEFAKMHPEV